MILEKFLIIILILIFCLYNFEYLYQRYKENRLLNNNNNFNHDDNDDLSLLHYDINEWLKNNYNLVYGENSSDIKDISVDKSLCKGIVVEIDDGKENCNHLSQKLCDGKVLLRKITIPMNSTIDFYSHSGYKLTKGRSYCVYKPPPDINDCDETWGYWKYSLKYEMWQCKSKVPGVYNSEKNVFDPCQKGGGSLFHNGHYLSGELIPMYFSPEQFYSIKFQRQFACDCPRGYISRPELSRTTCFKDPCLIDLPPHAEAAGYDVKTGNCYCKPYFYNLYPDNPKSPCTMCPDAPMWDYRNNFLIIYVKCGENHKFKCITEEDKIRGCVITKLKVKLKDSDNLKNVVFF